ncbi:MAG: hypothetical protein R3290_07115 [Acidimicrobiia bacterium]|nr:hypothetical protein [Acidimicrobiia bacterium]
MRRLLRFAVWTMIVAAVTRVAADVASRRYRGATDPDDDEFRLACHVGGVDAASHAASLRSVGLRLRIGGISLDLSGATLDPDGAVVDVDLLAGGVALTVDPSWRVDVESTLAAGDVAVDLPPPEVLPDGAPRLLVRVGGRAGGVTIAA